jgi:transcriptional regulator with XRE-family HTH domain
MKDHDFLIQVASKIRLTRMKRGISQADLAQKCSYDKAAMSRIESGRVNLTILTLFKVSKALDVTIQDILGPDASSSKG